MVYTNTFKTMFNLNISDMMSIQICFSFKHVQMYYIYSILRDSFFRKKIVKNRRFITDLFNLSAIYHQIFSIYRRFFGGDARPRRVNHTSDFFQ